MRRVPRGGGDVVIRVYPTAADLADDLAADSLDRLIAAASPLGPPRPCPACAALPGAPCTVVPGARLRGGQHAARRPPKGPRGRQRVGVRVEVRLPVDVHARAVARAGREGVAVAEVIREAVVRGLD